MVLLIDLTFPTYCTVSSLQTDYEGVLGLAELQGCILTQLWKGWHNREISCISLNKSLSGLPSRF